MIEVRPAAESDVQTLAAVHVQAWQDAYRGQMPDDFLDGLSIPSFERWWRAEVTSPDRPTWVGVLDSTIRGFTTVGASRDQDADGAGEVWAINMVRQAWGSGLGQMLFDTGTAWLAEQRFADATLWVLDTNARARRFYERNGWRPDGATKVDDRGTFRLHEVRYRIALA